MRQLPFLDDQRLLEALQATIVYVLLQALDSQTIPEHDTRSLTVATLVSSRLPQAKCLPCLHSTDTYGHAHLNRNAQKNFTNAMGTKARPCPRPRQRIRNRNTPRSRGETGFGKNRSTG